MEVLVESSPIRVDDAVVLTKAVLRAADKLGVRA